VAEGSNQSESGAFTDLEQSFFEAAPPDVPLAPPEPMRFDDLVAGPARLPRKPQSEPHLSQLLASRGRRLVVAPMLWGGRSLVELAMVGWRRLLPGLRAMRTAVQSGIGVAVTRLAAELPKERPDRRSIVAAMAVLVVVMTLSAGVVAHSGTWITLRAPAAGTSGGERGGAVVAGLGNTPAAECPAAAPVAPAAALAPPAKIAHRPRSHHVSKSDSHQRKVAIVPARPAANARKPAFSR
jgi:hypothetical protein